MKQIYHISDEQKIDLISRTAVTIGNFDGCHRGHQKLITSAIKHAQQLNITSLALTFNPRPDNFFKSSFNADLLFTLEQKIRAFKEAGIDSVCIQLFNEKFSKISAQDFVSNYLLQTLQAKSVTVGENFRFGNSRYGNTETLTQLGQDKGLQIEICNFEMEKSEVISSSRIRKALLKGEVQIASAMLGRPYLLEGNVIKGDQIGRTLGTPTANLYDVKQIIPAPGVYLVRAHIGASPQVLIPSPTALPAVCNIGYRPTVQSSQPELRIETHILVGNIGLNELYGMPLGIYFDDRLRDEKKFQNFTELKNAISSDLAVARNFYKINN